MRRIVESLWVLVAVFPAAVFGQAAPSLIYEEGKSIPVVLYPSAEPRPARKVSIAAAVLGTHPGQCGRVLEPDTRRTAGLLRGIQQGV